ncbi:hypothetical protein J6P92_03210 [bacterium]|nr:hypothetical protein [bacterium]
MAKKRYLKLEYSIFIYVIVAVMLLIIPFSFENSIQAGFISKWNEKYNKIEYMFSVIKAHITDDMLTSMKKAQTSHDREKLLIELVKPYIRVNTVNKPKRYRPKLMNGSKITKKDLYYFEDVYFAENNKIVVGIKNIHTVKPSDPLFVMMVDVNGVMPPNRWGKDIFGIRIYDNVEIKPFGEGLDMNAIKDDCSKTGTGGACSYYYTIGGGFDD